MDQNHWLARMAAAVTAALGADCTEETLERLYAAGIYAVRARAADCATGGCES